MQGDQSDEAHVQSPYAQRDESPIPGTSHQIDEPNFNTAQDDDAHINDQEEAINDDDVVEEIKPEPNDMSDSSSDEVEILENDAEEPENSDDEIKIIPQEIN